MNSIEKSENSLADQHAKRLKVAKSSRVTLGMDVQKPIRARNTDIGDIDLTLAGKSSDLSKGGAVQAQLPQSLNNQMSLEGGNEDTGNNPSPLPGYQQPFAVPPRPQNMKTNF